MGGPIAMHLTDDLAGGETLTMQQRFVLQKKTRPLRALKNHENKFWPKRPAVIISRNNQLGLNQSTKLVFDQI